MRRVLAGPGTNNYKIGQDSGKQAPAGRAGDGYRGTNVGAAAGPTSSHRFGSLPFL